MMVLTVNVCMFSVATLLKAVSICITDGIIATPEHAWGGRDKGHGFGELDLLPPPDFCSYFKADVVVKAKPQ